MEAHGFSVDFRQATGNRLTPHEVIERAREEFRVHGIGNQRERQEQWIRDHARESILENGLREYQTGTAKIIDLRQKRKTFLTLSLCP
jgi:hypothetical protein